MKTLADKLRDTPFGETLRFYGNPKDARQGYYRYKTGEPWLYLFAREVQEVCELPTPQAILFIQANDDADYKFRMTSLNFHAKSSND